MADGAGTCDSARALDEANATIANLRAALATARTVGAATGILVERYKLPVDDAFALLVESSQHTQVKLRAVAEHLVLTGELLTPPKKDPQLRRR